ncbi:MAG: hypothetical protein EBT08_09195 [Betaproteobacteria bacterium]|nr:hypothetical protein [Betaproteobacteria bacterium]
MSGPPIGDPIAPDALAHQVEDALGVTGALAAGSAWRDRPNQRAMAGAIAQAISEQSTLVAEAGTGIGKTFAYLAPALLAGGKVIISTGTKTLQDQLFARDLPRVVAALGVNVRCALVTWRTADIPGPSISVVCTRLIGFPGFPQQVTDPIVPR